MTSNWEEIGTRLYPFQGTTAYQPTLGISWGMFEEPKREIEENEKNFLTQIETRPVTHCSIDFPCDLHFGVYTPTLERVLAFLQQRYPIDAWIKYVRIYVTLGPEVWHEDQNLYRTPVRLYPLAPAPTAPTSTPSMSTTPLVAPPMATPITSPPVPQNPLPTPATPMTPMTPVAPVTPVTPVAPTVDASWASKLSTPMMLPSMPPPMLPPIVQSSTSLSSIFPNLTPVSQGEKRDPLEELAHGTMKKMRTG